MTDKEIKSAMEACLNRTDRCVCTIEDCPYAWEDECSIDLWKDALDLINRQQVEIDRLKASPKINESTLTKKLKAVANGEKVDFYDGTERGDVIAAMCYDAYYVILGLKARIKEIEAEAIKEFAEKLKAEHSTPDILMPFNWISIEDTALDQLVAEMVGADE